MTRTWRRSKRRTSTRIQNTEGAHCESTCTTEARRRRHTSEFRCREESADSRPITYDVSATTTARTFDVLFSLRAGTGDTGSDGNGSSRGDSYVKPAHTTIRTDNDFDGGFVVGTGSQLYDTQGTLGRQNKQNSSVKVSDTILPVTIEDGSGVQDGNTCTIAECAGDTVGEWTRIECPRTADDPGDDGSSGVATSTAVFRGRVYALHDPDGAVGDLRHQGRVHL